MKEYDYAHQMNRPVPLEMTKEDVAKRIRLVTGSGKPTGALILHRAIKKASNAPTRTPRS
ncbi:hypothetical protein [Stenotrophomonas phage vB_SmaS_P15]|uniref:Uncharacterized protein n=1 Tax=Stenotrophomonas phage vB_SmaS_P15 TaxID=2894592 RepID=A0AAE8YFN9_9CAUD|nr:hypothetical protein [Stenotrophomonas phage vB_SmaS_P15]